MKILRRLIAAALLAGAARQAWAACATSVFVTNTPGAIQSAVNAIPTPLTGDWCIFLATGVYSESVTIQGIDPTPSFRIVISTYAAALGATVIEPSAASAAAFNVLNASVTLNGMTIMPAAAGVGWGVRASSPSVSLTTMTIDDAGGFTYASGGVAIASFTTVLNSSVALANAAAGIGLAVYGSNDAISVTTMTTASAAQPALYFNSASGGSVSGSYAQALAGTAVFFDAASDFNAVSQSTAIAAAAAPAMSLAAMSSSNTISASFLLNSGGPAVVQSNAHYNSFVNDRVSANSAGAGGFHALNSSGTALSGCSLVDQSGPVVFLDSAASYGSISQSVLQGLSVAGYGLFINGTSSENVVTQSLISNPFGTAALISEGLNNSITQSTMTSSAAGAALFVTAASSNVVIGSFLSNSGGAALELDAGAAYNQVSQSTMTASGASPALMLDAASFNSVSLSYAANLSGSQGAASLANGSNGNTVTLSTMIANAAGFPGLLLSNASSNTVVDSFIANALGDGADVTSNSAYDSVVLSTVTSAAAGRFAFAVTGSSFDAVTQDYIQDMPGTALELGTGAAFNTVSLSTMVSSVAGLLMSGASSNTVTQSYVRALAGTAASLTAGSDYNSISQSTMVCAAAAGRALSVSGSSVNVVQQSLMINSSALGGAGGAAAVVSGSSFTLITQSTMTANVFGGSGVLLDAGGSTVTLSVLTEPSGYAARANGNALGSGVTSSLLSGATAFFVNGATATFISGDSLQSVGFGASALAVAGGGGATYFGASTMTFSGVDGLALTEGGPGPLQATGPGYFFGDVRLTGGALQAGSFAHVVTGSMTISAAAGLVPQGSTIVFSGAGLHVVSAPAGASFNGLVALSSVQFMGGGASISALTDDVAASTLTFAAGQLYTISDLEIHGAGPPNGFVALRSGTPGFAWRLDNVAVSSVTSARVSDSDATPGRRVDANDLTSVDAGGNSNWNFLPFLNLALPGQVFVPGAGVTGAASNQKAGVPFTATVYAVSSSSYVVAAAFPVALVSNDLYASPSSTQAVFSNLASGIGAFTADLVIAQAASLSASAPIPLTAFAGATDFLTVTPGTFTTLQVLLPNEVPDPGSPTTKANPPDVQVQGVPIPAVTVRGVDRFGNLQPSVVDAMAIVGTNASSATWQSAAQAAAGGITVFASTVTIYSTGTATVVIASDTAGGVANGRSTPFIVVPPSVSSPTINVNVAGSTVATLGGGPSGGAGDAAAVNKVLVAAQSASSGLWFGPWTAGAGSFANAAPVFGTATLTAQGAPFTQWSLALADSALQPGASYYVEAVAIDASRLSTTALVAFLFNPAALSAGPGGQGSATVVPAVSSGCEPLIATVTYHAGAAGLQPGGGVALRVPQGWTPPQGATTSLPAPPGLGFFLVTSTSAAMASASVQVNPPSLGAATLGAGWIAVTAGAAAFKPGEDINFIYSALPPLGPTGRGTQAFSLLSRPLASASAGAVGPAPALTLGPGTTNYLAFADASPLLVRLLRPSATMQLALTDLCGNPTSTPTVTAAMMSAVIGSPAQADATAVFYASGGGAVSSVAIPAGASLSQPFYYVTSTAGVAAETLQATATVQGLSGPAFSLAARLASLTSSTPTLTGVEVDTGTASPGVFAATVTYGLAHTRAFVRFGANLAGLPWEVAISTDANPATFFPVVFRSGGVSDPQHPQVVTWDGLGGLLQPPQYVPPGSYHVRVALAGGVVVDTSTTIQIPQSPSVIGNLGAAGAGAFVSAAGPGAGYGNDAVATSTGYFQVFGLVDQGAFNVTATTSVFVLGQSVSVTTTALSVVASNAGTLIPGALALPPTSFLRVSVTLPTPAPRDAAGSVSVHNASYTATGLGTVHFPPGFASSDDGGQSFGRTPSTWTLIALPPDLYSLDVSIPDLGISTTIAAKALGPGAVVDVPISLVKKANLYGFVVLPSTTALGSGVSLQAQAAGAAAPTVFASAFVGPDSASVHPTSAAYALFGLDPGSWTVTAKSFGFASTATTVLVSTSAADLAGLVLPLSTGGVIVGTASFAGATAGVGGPGCAGGGFLLGLQAYDLQTGAVTQTQVCAPRAAGPSASTFTIGGLDSGSYRVTAAVPGFDLVPSSGVLVAVSTPAVSAAALAFAPSNASAAITVWVPPLPGGVCRSTGDYAALGFSAQGPGPGLDMNLSAPSVTSLTPFELGPSSYTDAARSAIEEYWCSSMTLLLPPQVTGSYAFSALWAPTGASQSVSAELSDGATAALALRVDGATYPVSGLVTFSGAVTLPPARAGGFAVSVSSVPGLISASSGAAYCLLSSSNPASLSAFHLELVPLPALPSAETPALAAAPGAGSCASVAAQSGVTTLGYAAAIHPDGSFSFPGVPPGSYLLRADADLDSDSADGLELAPFQTVVRVAGPVSGLAVPLTSGRSISGSLILPPGVQTSRPVAVLLQDLLGGAVAAYQTAFDASGFAAYRFANVADGSYVLLAKDLGSPAAFVARPLAVTVAGAALAGEVIPMLPGATIKASIGLRQPLPGGGGQVVVVSSQNAALLPPGLTVDAVGPGGYYPAAAPNCTALGCAGGAPSGVTLDGDGKAAISDVLPGTYDVEFNVPAGSAAAAGTLGLVSAARSGVTVGAGQTVDLGVVTLSAGASLGGTVTDVTTSSPIANVLMLARPDVVLPGQTSGRLAYPTAVTDNAGHYAFTGLDPAVRYYDVFAAARLGAHQGDAAAPYAQAIAPSVDLRSTATLNFALTPASLALSGQALGLNGEQLYSAFGQDGQTAPGALVYVQKAGVVPTANPIADIVFFTDAQGNFTIPALAPGTYRVSVAAIGYQTDSFVATLSTASLGVGAVQLSYAATLKGAIAQADGTAPTEDEIGQVVGATPDMTDAFFGQVTRDPVTRAITGYVLSGFQLNRAYRLLFLSSDGQQVVSPPEAASVVFTSSRQVQQLDVMFRPAKPFVAAKDVRAGAGFGLVFQFSQPLRERAASDDDLALILTTAGAAGQLSNIALDSGRRTLTASYAPAVGESSFTLHVRAYTSARDPSSLDPVNPEPLVDSTASFYVGIDGAHRANVNNAAGGTLVVEGDAGRVTLPKGAFGVDASSSVTVLLQKFTANTDTSGQQGTLSAAERLAFLPHAPGAYPPHLLQALAALPPTVTPFSGFYDVLLPLGVRTALSRPTPLTIAYSTGTDPSTLNVYWYNAAANAYVLQQDVTGALPVIDAVNHTITLNVNHFSTFVLFNTGVEVISGNAFPGADIEAYNFPNPFDLTPKIVHAIHGGSCQPNCAVRGTLIRFSLPADLSGDASIRIFNVAGDRVRTIDLGTLAGGNYYYQEWDGRNDGGVDVASGVYIGQVKVGGKSKFFKMALIK